LGCPFFEVACQGQPCGRSDIRADAAGGKRRYLRAVRYGSVTSSWQPIRFSNAQGDTVEDGRRDNLDCDSYRLDVRSGASESAKAGSSGMPSSEAAVRAKAMNDVGAVRVAPAGTRPGARTSSGTARS